MDSATILRTSRLLSDIGDAAQGESITFAALLGDFRQRAFGALLLVVLLPTFIPVPVGIGGVTGPLIALVGAQMLVGLRKPWLPKWLGRRGLKRETVKRFSQRFRPLLVFLERFCRPRLTQLMDHTWAHVLTGLLLVLLGLLLSLPVPFTNYPIGVVLLLYCIGLIERDGVLLMSGWVLGAGLLVGSALLSSEVVDLIGRLFG